MSYQPPFDVTPKIVNQISAIAENVGRFDRFELAVSPQLRRQNRIRTIQGSLAIEGNTLSLSQVTAILEGRRVLGPLLQTVLDKPASDQAGDQVKKLFAVMGDGYCSAQTLMTRLGLSHRPTFRKNYLNPALREGLLEMQYPDKPRSPKQQYRKSVS